MQIVIHCIKSVTGVATATTTMKFLNAILFAFANAGSLEKDDKTGISTAAFDEKTPNITKIGCGRGTIVVTKVFEITF